jgi:hypothetical protein
VPCEHLRPLEEALRAEGFACTFRGQAWSEAQGIWAYYNCIMEVDTLRKRFALPNLVETHSHRGTHDGSELGFICTSCGTGLMGELGPGSGARVFCGQSDAPPNKSLERTRGR